MKKLIWILGVIFLTVIVILNIIFTTEIDAAEHVTISINNFIYIIGIIGVGLAIFLLFWSR